MGKEKASLDLHTTAQHNCGFKNKPTNRTKKQQTPNNNKQNHQKTPQNKQKEIFVLKLPKVT